jgi:hypothetical protein
VTNPAPVASSLSPSTATAGGPAFMLVVNGSGFVPSSVVRWNGGTRSTTFVSGTELQASITAADIAAAGSVPVTVVTPAPGGGTSTALTFTITAASPVATTLSPATTVAGGAAFTLTVTGTNFSASSVVQWNGASRATTFVSSTELRAAISAGDIALAGTAQVTVVTASATSDALIFAVTSSETGLVGFWMLDEGTGTRTYDLSGDNHPGTLINGPAWSSGALAFDGANDYVEVAHAPDLNAYPLTVSTWVKTTSTNGVRGIVNKYVGGSSNGWSLFLNNGNVCAWYYRSATNFVSNASGCPFNVAGVNDGAWHHVVFVVDIFGGRVYVDGVRQLIISWTGSAGATSTAQPVHVGRYPGAAGGAEYFPGLMDNVRIYNRALNGTEVLNLYTREASETRP